MASAFNFNAGESNYTGEVLGDLLTLTAQENETYKEGLIHVKSGIQKKYALPSVQLGKIIQDRKPIPDGSVGEYTFAERYLEPEDFMVYMRFNPRDFEEYYRPFQPKGNLVFRTLDPKVQATMIRLLMERKMEYINHAIWCSAMPEQKAKIASADGSVAAGATEIGGEDAAGEMKYFNGAICRMLMNAAAAATSEDAKSGQINVAGTGTFADGAAVESELYAMWEATEPKIRKKSGLVILMDYKSWDAYNRYLSDKTVKYSDNRKENEHRFQGKRIIPKNDMMVYEMLARNDWKRPLYMSVTLGSDNYAGLQDYLVLEGLAYRITPFHMGMAIDADKMYDNMMNRFRYGNVKAPGIYLDETVMRMCQTHRHMFMMLAKQFLTKGDTARALKVLRKCKAELPAVNIPYDTSGADHELVQLWMAVGQKKEAARVAEALGTSAYKYLTWVNTLGDRASRFVRNCERQATMLSMMTQALKDCSSPLAKTFDRRFRELEQTPAIQLVLQSIQDREAARYRQMMQEQQEQEGGGVQDFGDYVGF